MDGHFPTMHPVLGLLAAPSPTLSTAVSQAAPVCCPGGASLEGHCRCPLISGDPGNKGLPDSKSSQTRTGALHWRRPHPPAWSCQPGQALPLTSSMAWGGGPQAPEAHSHLYHGDDPENLPPPAAGKSQRDNA